MTARRTDPARLFVRGFGVVEGIEWGFWLVLTVFWIVELELGPAKLVLLGIVLEASVLLAETPTGVVADLQSRKRSLVIAQVVMGISFLWSVASTNYWVILPAQMLVGIGWTFRSGADTAWVTDELKGVGTFDDDDVERLLLRRHRFGIAFSLLDPAGHDRCWCLDVGALGGSNDGRGLSAARPLLRPRHDRGAFHTG